MSVGATRFSLLCFTCSSAKEPPLAHPECNSSYRPFPAIYQKMSRILRGLATVASIFLVCIVIFASADETVCDNGLPVASCFLRPCLLPAPEGCTQYDRCEDDFCGGCFRKYYSNNRRVCHGTVLAYQNSVGFYARPAFCVMRNFSLSHRVLQNVALPPANTSQPFLFFHISARTAPSVVLQGAV